MADYNLQYTGAQIDALLDAANELKTNGYIYKGVATPSTNPGTPTERVAYLASEPGTYTNFGGIVITSGLYSLTYAGSTWTATQMSAVNLSNINNTAIGGNDLVISDENDNDIVRFVNGHIKTKNFNSEEVNIDHIPILKFIKNKYSGKRCAIIGDSISTYEGTMPTGYATHYPRGNVTSVNYMWWKITCDTLGMTPVNCAWSGSRVTGAPKGSTASAGCSDMRIADAARNGTPDIIIFFISCNDWGNDVPLGTWSVDDTIVDDSNYSTTDTISTLRPAYALMLKKARVAYPHCKLFCCSNLDELRRDDVGPGEYPPINKSLASGGVSNYTWNQNLREIAEALGASFIDVHDCGINIFNLADYYSDDGDLHPNREGQALIAEKVISALISK